MVAKFVVTLALIGMLLVATSMVPGPLHAERKGAAGVDRKATDKKKDRKKIIEPADYGLPQVRMINRSIRDGWQGYDVTPSKKATDGEWCRRVYLDVIGRIPSIKELTTFTKDKSQDKKAKLVSRLLSSEYEEDYARNWTTLWTNILIGRNGGMERNSLVSREGMQKYLRDSFYENRPYDQMVSELVSATGIGKPGAVGFNGAANFLAGKMEEKGLQATAKTAQVFLGLQIQCTQCHNHPFNDWKQNRFWELNAFFRQTRALRTFVSGTRNVSSVELANEDFAGEGNDPSEAELYYELRNGLLKVAYPVFVDGKEISKSGYLEDSNRRGELAKFIRNSDFMPKVAVNRMWGHFLGYGFTKPVDDLGPHNPPSHPELMDALAGEYKKRSYNTKELIRWITLSEAYSLSSRTTKNNKSDDPLLGESPKFSHFYLRQIRAEELYESLVVATQAHKTRGSYKEQEAKKREWLRQFVVAFGTDEGDETTTFNGTIPQVLMLMNGDLVKTAIDLKPGSMLSSVAASRKLNNRKKIEYLFLAALARKPNSAEIQVANQLYAARGGKTAEALQDIWWALLNSNEFIMNH